MNVAVLGASNKPDRYSFKAVQLLRQKGHAVYPVHPALAEVDGLRVWPSLSAIPVPLDTVTVYMSPKNQQHIADELLNCSARRVIFNPGTENPDLAGQLRHRGKEVLYACTLVLLTTGQFAKKADDSATVGGRRTKTQESRRLARKSHGVTRLEHPKLHCREISGLTHRE